MQPFLCITVTSPLEMVGGCLHCLELTLSLQSGYIKPWMGYARHTVFSKMLKEQVRHFETELTFPDNLAAVLPVELRRCLAEAHHFLTIIRRKDQEVLTLKHHIANEEAVISSLKEIMDTVRSSLNCFGIQKLEVMEWIPLEIGKEEKIVKNLATRVAQKEAEKAKYKTKLLYMELEIARLEGLLDQEENDSTVNLGTVCAGCYDIHVGVDLWSKCWRCQQGRCGNCSRQHCSCLNEMHSPRSPSPASTLSLPATPSPPPSAPTPSPPPPPETPPAPAPPAVAAVTLRRSMRHKKLTPRFVVYMCSLKKNNVFLK